MLAEEILDENGATYSEIILCTLIALS